MSVLCAVALVAVLAVSCLSLSRGPLLTSISDIVTALLMSAALFSFAYLGFNSRGRMRWFWTLQAAGWALWLSDQFVWIYYDLYLGHQMPPMHPADSLLFLAGAPMMAGLLLRPHLEPSARSARLGVMDFCLLLLWWIYLYISLVVCWQYAYPNQEGYNRNFDRLSLVEAILLTAVLVAFWAETSGRWRRFYVALCGAVIFNYVWFFVLNRAIEKEVYFTGSWYDVPYSGSFALYAAAALLGYGLVPS